MAVRAAAERHTSTAVRLVSVSVETAITAFMLGPVGAAVVAVWSRDEMVFKCDAGCSMQKSQWNRPNVSPLLPNLQDVRLAGYAVVNEDLSNMITQR